MVKRPVLLLVALAVVCSVQAQTPAPPAQSTTAADVYHVHFVKAAAGKAADLGNALKTQSPNPPMPGHYVVLRHEQGDDWDYVVIEHLGTSVPVSSAGTPPNVALRPLREWHTDTFVSGPSWQEFSTALALGAPSASTPSNPVYAVSTYRSVPGQRDQLEQTMKRLTASAKVPANNVLLQHLEGAAWEFLYISRFDSWQDFAANQTDPDALTRAKRAGIAQDPWVEIRQYANWHRDTLADRVTPAPTAAAQPAK